MKSTPDTYKVYCGDKKPFIKSMKKGTYAWCSCGRSENQPFCDGSHVGTNMRPIVVELNKDRIVSWCSCKHSKAKPYCDGNHMKV